MTKLTLAILTLIAILGFGLRIYRLSDRPLGFTWDEAALGYNAYSLIQTGRDEHGQIAPIVFKSFGDYKPGLYVYLAVPFVKVFGLTETSTRLPSAISGTLLVVLVFLLTTRLLNRTTAIWASLLLAINPWAIHFSRAAWESNVNLMLIALAVVLFQKKRFLLSFIFAGLTLWTYQGAKLFTPLILLSLVWLSRSSIKNLIKPGFILLLLAAPILLGVSGQSGRLKVFSVFSYQRPPEVVSEVLRQDSTKTQDLTYYLFHSELLDQLRGVTQRYLNHFSLRFLFVEGDWSNPRQSTPFTGYMYLPEVVTLLAGMYFLITTNNFATKFLLTWLLLAPIPSALSRDIISAVRSLPMMLPLVIISGFGLTSLFRKKIFLYPFLLILTFFFIYFIDLYFIHAPNYTSSGWLFPYKPALFLVKDNQDLYSRIVISDKLGQPYIFTLFYLQIDPQAYQGRSRSIDSPVGDVGSVTSFDKFEFRPIFWPADRGLSSTLFVGHEFELPETDLESTANLHRLGDIATPDRAPLWKVVALP